MKIQYYIESADKSIAVCPKHAVQAALKDLEITLDIEWGVYEQPCEICKENEGR